MSVRVDFSRFLEIFRDMKFIAAAVVFISLALNVSAGDIHGVAIKSLQGEKLDLADYKGKAMLFVNVASECGYTGQYDGLQSLYQRMKDKGLVVIGVPCNEFGRQEPGSPKQIAAFCKRNYGVTFPLTEKIAIQKGKKQHALYQHLTKGGKQVGWNFEKFLVGKDGKVVQHFSSDTEPNAPALLAAINKALK